LSRPTRARGLKRCRLGRLSTGTFVAPHAGAWIETICQADLRAEVLSRPTRARGLKHRVEHLAHRNVCRVAPHAGAWIETIAGRGLWGRDWSRPTRARGLKPRLLPTSATEPPVAPHAGAWIETTKAHARPVFEAVAPHAGAWIETQNGPRSRRISKSRPTRARGLKQDGDWIPFACIAVAPHAGAWIETLRAAQARCRLKVAPHTGAWIETLDHMRYCLRPCASRPTRARGLKPNPGTEVHSGDFD